MWNKGEYILKIYTFVPLWKEIQQWLISISFYGKSRPRIISSPSNVYLSYIIRLFAYIPNVFISDRETREDIVQEVFSSIWENRKRIVIRTSARNYLITATKNHSLNYLQRNHEEYVDQFSQEQIPIYAESGEELYTWEELQTLLREALAKLPENYRYVFEKNRFENKSYGEIAEDMQISIRTVERYKNKAIEILKTELKDYLPLFIGWLF